MMLDLLTGKQVSNLPSRCLTYENIGLLEKYKSTSAGLSENENKSATQEK